MRFADRKTKGDWRKYYGEEQAEGGNEKWGMRSEGGTYEAKGSRWEKMISPPDTVDASRLRARLAGWDWQCWSRSWGIGVGECVASFGAVRKLHEHTQPPAGIDNFLYHISNLPVDHEICSSHLSTVVTLFFSLNFDQKSEETKKVFGASNLWNDLKCLSLNFLSSNAYLTIATKLFSYCYIVILELLNDLKIVDK